MTAFYNEIDPNAAQWLRNLIAAGHIAPGVVDERSIEDITPDELKDFTQVHFFAGIGVWSYALRRAGWPDDRPVWTGSCPCQPFSAAGKGGGFTDERHLWPHLHYLIEQCRPGIVFGEQVASKDGLNWFDLVQTDLEGAGYAAAAFDICAAGVGAPHVRQRLYWVADANHAKSQGGQPRLRESKTSLGEGAAEKFTGCSAADGVAYASNEGSQRRLFGGPDSRGEAIDGHARCDSTISEARPTNGEWADADWLYCRDGKWRPVEPGTSPLVNGATGRVGRLRAYGNAIAAPVAQVFIESYLEAANENDFTPQQIPRFG